MARAKSNVTELPRRKKPAGPAPAGAPAQQHVSRVAKKFRVFSVRAGLDLPFLFLVLVLLVIGLIMMFSASYASAYYYYGNSYFFISKQALFAAAGVAVMIALSYFDYHHFHRLAVPILIFSYALLVLVGSCPPSTGCTGGSALARSARFSRRKSANLR